MKMTFSCSSSACLIFFLRLRICQGRTRRDWRSGKKRVWRWQGQGTRHPRPRDSMLTALCTHCTPYAHYTTQTYTLFTLYHANIHLMHTIPCKHTPYEPQTHGRATRDEREMAQDGEKGGVERRGRGREGERLTLIARDRDK